MFKQGFLELALAASFASAGLASAQSAVCRAGAAGQGVGFPGEIDRGNDSWKFVKDVWIGGDHIAWVEDSSGKRTVRLDGNQQGGAYDDVKYMKFSWDATRLVSSGSAVRRGSRSWTVRINRSVTTNSREFRFSPAGLPTRLSHAGKRNAD